MFSRFASMVFVFRPEYWLSDFGVCVGYQKVYLSLALLRAPPHLYYDASRPPRILGGDVLWGFCRLFSSFVSFRFSTHLFFLLCLDGDAYTKVEAQTMVEATFA